MNAAQQRMCFGVVRINLNGAQRSMLPWLYDEIAEMDALMGDDPWPYGLEPNRKILEAFMSYLAEQHFLEKAPSIDELFTPIVNWSE